MKARCKHRGRPSSQSSRLARREMNHLNQKLPAQNDTTLSGTLHGRGTPIEEDNSKVHCRQGGSGAGIPTDTPHLGRTTKLKQFFSLSAIRAAAGVDGRPGRTKEAGTEAQSGAGRQVKGAAVQGRAAL